MSERKWGLWLTESKAWLKERFTSPFGRMHLGDDLRFATEQEAQEAIPKIQCLAERVAVREVGQDGKPRRWGVWIENSLLSHGWQKELSGSIREFASYQDAKNAVEIDSRSVARGALSVREIDPQGKPMPIWGIWEPVAYDDDGKIVIVAYDDDGKIVAPGRWEWARTSDSVKNAPRRQGRWEFASEAEATVESRFALKPNSVRQIGPDGKPVPTPPKEKTLVGQIKRDDCPEYGVFSFTFAEPVPMNEISLDLDAKGGVLSDFGFYCKNATLPICLLGRRDGLPNFPMDRQSVAPIHFVRFTWGNEWGASRFPADRKFDIKIWAHGQKPFGPKEVTGKLTCDTKPIQDALDALAPKWGIWIPNEQRWCGSCPPTGPLEFVCETDAAVYANKYAGPTLKTTIMKIGEYFDRDGKPTQKANEAIADAVTVLHDDNVKLVQQAAEAVRVVDDRAKILHDVERLKAKVERTEAERDKARRERGKYSELKEQIAQRDKQIESLAKQFKLAADERGSLRSELNQAIVCRKMAERERDGLLESQRVARQERDQARRERDVYLKRADEANAEATKWRTAFHGSSTFTWNGAAAGATL